MDAFIVNAPFWFDRCYIPLKVRATQINDNTKYIVGFDVKYVNNDGDLTPAFMILTTQDICFIIDLIRLKDNMPYRLVELMCDSNWIKSGVNIKKKFKDILPYFNDEICGEWDIQKEYTKYDDANDIKSMYNKIMNSNVHDYTDSDICTSNPYGCRSSSDFIEISIRSILSYHVGYTLINSTPEEIMNLITMYNSMLLFINPMICKMDNFPYIHLHKKIPMEYGRYNLNLPVGNISTSKLFCKYNMLGHPKYNNYTKDGQCVCECRLMDKVTVAEANISISAKYQATEKMMQFYDINVDTIHPKLYSKSCIMNMKDDINYIEQLDMLTTNHNLNKPRYNTRRTMEIFRLGIWQYRTSCIIMVDNSNAHHVDTGYGNTPMDAENHASRKMIRRIEKFCL